MLEAISILLRLIGLGEWVDGWLRNREAKKQAQAIASSPTTKEELDEVLKDHSF